MSDFRTAVLKTLMHEGGYVNSPNDSGGPTNMGITQRDMPGVDIATITVDQAVAYYAEHYWKQLYSQINSQALAEKIFDMGVLFGVGTAVKIFQSTIHVFPADGAFGPATLAATNQVNPDVALMDFKANLVTHIFNIATANPKDRIFLKGWAARINI